MDQQYDNEKRGVLFKNDRKEKPEHPDYRGSLQLEGVEYWLSGWKKPGKMGKPAFLSLALTRKDSQQSQGGTKKEQPKQSDDFMEDDIPF